MIQPANLTISQSIQMQRFASALQVFFRKQSQEVIGKLTLDQIRNGITVDLSHWTKLMEQVFQPFIAQFTQNGLVIGAQRVSQAVQNTPRKALLAYRSYPRLRPIFHRFLAPQIVKAPRPSIGFDLALSNARVADQINHHTFTFCEETNATASERLNTALAKLRDSLKEGIPQGEAITTLTDRVREIFDDPFRAYRIADTETTRALAGGEFLSARESGVIETKRWLASVGACDFCANMDLEDRNLEDPFYINPKGGPYAVIMFTPAHPFCRCNIQYIAGAPKQQKPVGFHQSVSIGGIRYNRADAQPVMNRIVNAIPATELPKMEVLKAEVSAALDVIERGVLDPKKVAEAVGRGRFHLSHTDGSQDMKIARGTLEAKLGTERYWGSEITQPFNHPGNNQISSNVITRTNPLTRRMEILLRVDDKGVWSLPSKFQRTLAPKGLAWRSGAETQRSAANRGVAELFTDRSINLRDKLERIGVFTENELNNDESWATINAFKIHLTPTQSSRAIINHERDSWIPVDQLPRYKLAAGVDAILKRGLK
jgi:hypothetical protein